MVTNVQESAARFVTWMKRDMQKRAEFLLPT